MCQHSIYGRDLRPDIHGSRAAIRHLCHIHAISVFAVKLAVLATKCNAHPSTFTVGTTALARLLDDVQTCRHGQLDMLHEDVRCVHSGHVLFIEA